MGDYDLYFIDPEFTDNEEEIIDNYDENGFDFSAYFSNTNAPSSSSNIDPSQETNEDTNVVNLQNHLLEPKRPRKTPENVTSDMTPSQLKFRENFYKHFTGSKKNKVRKELIIKNYHPKIVAKLRLKYKDLKIRDTVRKEQRSIGHYFINFAVYEDKIMEAIIELEKDGEINYQRDIQEYRPKNK